MGNKKSTAEVVENSDIPEMLINYVAEKITKEKYRCSYLRQCSQHVQSPLAEQISLLAYQAPSNHTHLQPAIQSASY